MDDLEVKSMSLKHLKGKHFKASGPSIFERSQFLDVGADLDEGEEESHAFFKKHIR